MFTTDRFTHFSYAYHWEEEKTLVTPVEGTEVMVSLFHLQQYRLRSGFSCWMILDTVSCETLDKVIRQYGAVVKGFLLRMSLSEWVTSSDLAPWFEQWGQAYRDRGYPIGILCEVDWNQLGSASPRWFYYHASIAVVVLKINKASGPFCYLLLYVIGFLVRMGIASNRIVAPFSTPAPTALDMYNLKGWVVTYQDVMQHRCWDYLPAHGMML